MLQLGLWPAVGLSAQGLKPRDSESWRLHYDRHRARLTFVAHTVVFHLTVSWANKGSQTSAEVMKPKKIGAHGTLGKEM